MRAGDVSFKDTLWWKIGSCQYSVLKEEIKIYQNLLEDLL